MYLLMASLITNAISWGPTAYYALGAINNLIGPSLIKALRGSALLAKDVFPEVYKQGKIVRPDIAIYQVPNLRRAAALGTSFSPSAVILVSKDLSALDRDASNYVCKHEISHIQENDGLVTGALASISSALSAYAIPFLKSHLPWWVAPLSNFAPLLIGRKVHNFVVSCFENRADRFASDHATVAELRGIERLVQGEIEVNQALQPMHPNCFSEAGNTHKVMGDSCHGPLTDRLEGIRDELRKRKQPAAKDPSKNYATQMKKIHEFHKNTYKDIFNLNVS